MARFRHKQIRHTHCVSNLLGIMRFIHSIHEWHVHVHQLFDTCLWPHCSPVSSTCSRSLSRESFLSSLTMATWRIWTIWWASLIVIALKLRGFVPHEIPKHSFKNCKHKHCMLNLMNKHTVRRRWRFEGRMLIIQKKFSIFSWGCGATSSSFAMLN